MNSGDRNINCFHTDVGEGQVDALLGISSDCASSITERREEGSGIPALDADLECQNDILLTPRSLPLQVQLCAALCCPAIVARLVQPCNTVVYLSSVDGG